MSSIQVKLKDVSLKPSSVNLREFAQENGLHANSTKNNYQSPKDRQSSDRSLIQVQKTLRADPALMRAKDKYGKDSMKEQSEEVSGMKRQIEQICKRQKIALPITRPGLMDLCKHLNVQITQIQAIEAMLYCRGKQMEQGDPEDFDMSKLVNFLCARKQFQKPSMMARRAKQANAYNDSPVRGGNNLPSLHNTVDVAGKVAQQMHWAGRSQLRSQQSTGSQEYRITQKLASRGQPYRNGSMAEDQMMNQQTSAQARKELERDPGFQREMRDCLKNLERMQGLRAKVFEKLSNVAQDWNDQKGMEGIIAGEKTRRRLAIRRKENELAEEKALEEMIQMTAQTSALQAINLSQLLKKKWTEERDAYQIQSKLTSAKQQRRLNDLCFNRYVL